LIYLKQLHRVSPLSPFQKEYESESNPSREQMNAAVFANRISWTKITIISLTEVTVNTKNVCLSECYKILVFRPEIGPKIFEKLKPEPGSTRKARLD